MNRRLLVLLLALILFAIIFFVSRADAYYCYQETANQSSFVDGNCLLNYTGAYMVVQKYFYVNYSRPFYADNNSQWVVKFGSDGSNPISQNITLNNSCFNDTIQLRFFSNVSSGVSYGQSYGQCYNGTNWLNITSNSLQNSGTIGFSGEGTALSNRIYDGEWGICDSNCSEFGGGLYLSSAFYRTVGTEERWTAPQADVPLTCNAMYATIYEEAMKWNIVDKIYPLLKISEPNGSYSGISYIPLKFYAYDLLADTCYYNITRGASLETANTKIDCNQNTTFSVSGDATYVLNLFINDTSGNINWTNTTFIISNYVQPQIINNGGSGGGINPTIQTVNETLAPNLEDNLFGWLSTSAFIVKGLNITRFVLIASVMVIFILLYNLKHRRKR